MSYTLGAVRHRVFVSYHHRGDQGAYDAFSRMFHDLGETVYDNSLDRQIDSDNSDYIMRSIRENYIEGTSCTIVLCGRDTWGRRWVDWEIDATLQKAHALVGVVLPSASLDANSFPILPGRLLDNVASGFALLVTWRDILANPSVLNRAIDNAKSRNKGWIDNSRARRLRSA